MAKPSYAELRWPYKGIHQGRAFYGQPPDTCVDARNVRSFDPISGRSRGAQRAGLTRFINATTTSNTIQDIAQIVAVQTSVTENLTQLQHRDTTNVVVSEGNVQHFTRAGGYTTAGSGAGALSATVPVIFSAPLFDKLYFADGTNDKYFDSSDDTVKAWSPSAGSLPGNHRLVELWRGRIVLSGVRSDPHNWFMSAQGDADDFDYVPNPRRVTQAVAGNNANAGKIGDIINCMIPYEDDVLIFGCDHSIWQMTGDPADGGRVDRISDITGMSFGRPYTRTPDGAIYFYGSRGGIYRMNVGSPPERLSSGRIEEQLADVNLDTHLVRGLYDDRTQLVHFYVTPLTAGASVHITYDVRHDAFWFDSFADNNYNPRAVLTLEGDDPNDRVSLLGSTDGYLRKIDTANENDDQKAIESYVYMGPLTQKDGNPMVLREMIATLDLDSHRVCYSVYQGDSAQAAFDLATDEAGEKFFTAFEGLSNWWGPGRNYPERCRVRGRAMYVKLFNFDKGERWSLERLMYHWRPTGKSATRNPC